MQAVPAVRYAFGVVGLAAAVAIILGIIRDPKIAFFGIAFMFVLMFILVIFANAAKAIPGIRALVAFLAWATSLLFVATLLAVFTSYVFGIPQTFAQYLRGEKPPPPDSKSDAGLKKTVALLDSASPDLVFDDRTRLERLTNANDIYTVLLPIKEIGDIRTFLVSPTNWNMQPEVIKYNPDLLIIHRSCFEGTTNNLKTDDERFDQFLRDMAKTKSKIFVYTRSNILANESAKAEWIHQTETLIPALKGRISLFTFRRDWQKTFRDNDVVANELRYQVRAILGLA